MEQRLEALLAHFTPEAHPLLELAHRIGAQAFAEVLRVLGGQRLTMPAPECFLAELERVLRDERIRGRFHGNNYLELADDFGLSERRVRQIVASSGGLRLSARWCEDIEEGMAA